MSRAKEMIKSPFELIKKAQDLVEQVFQEQEGEGEVIQQSPFWMGHDLGLMGTATFAVACCDCQDRRNSLSCRQTRTSWFRARSSNANRWNCLKNPSERWRRS